MTPKPDQDAGLIDEARDHASRMHPASHLGGMLTRLSDILALRDRQIAGLLEALTETKAALDRVDTDARIDLADAELWTQVALARQLAARTVRSLETEGET